MSEKGSWSSSSEGTEHISPRSIIRNPKGKIGFLWFNDRKKLPKVRYKTWYWSIWWWFGSHGLYKINWAWKEWRLRRAEYVVKKMRYQLNLKEGE